jgi:hypothetical protein
LAPAAARSTYREYASRAAAGAASHLDLFAQPAVVPQPASPEPRAERRRYRLDVGSAAWAGRRRRGGALVAAWRAVI